MEESEAGRLEVLRHRVLDVSAKRVEWYQPGHGWLMEAQRVDYRSALAEWFAEDDGSLPELVIAGLTAAEASALRARLQPDSLDVTPASELHWVVSPHIDGRLLPEIGVSVLEHSVVFDWRMGPAWDSPTIRAFLGLVADLMATCDAPRLELEKGTTAEAREHFMRFWADFAEARVQPSGHRAF